jgi:PHD/YefM family antitoxin component YafN of YafNO toxin-antitoxin module
MSESSVLLTDEDRFLLIRVSELLDEVIETLDILEDEEAMRSIREAIEDSREGRVRDYEEFIAEMKETGEI